jgi:propanediol utilization protein
MHLTREVMDTLFGPGSELTPHRYLLQRGEYASEQTVEMIGPRNRYPAVRILGPLRERMQVELSKTDTVFLGIDPPVGKFGPLPEGQSLSLVGPSGSVTVKENIMISRRHIHINPDEAAEIGIKDQQTVFVAPAQDTSDPLTSRIAVLGNVLVRVHPTYIKQLHIDTDEANATGLRSGHHVYVVQSSLGLYSEMPSKSLVTESDVRQAVLKKQKIRLRKGVIVTPAARDLGRQHRIFIE